MGKYKKSKKQVLFVPQSPSSMQKSKKIEANGEEFYYFKGLFKGLFLRFIFNMRFPIHFRYFTKTPFTFAAAKIKPLGVEKCLSPFWKVKHKPTTYVKIRENSNFDPPLPP